MPDPAATWLQACKEYKRRHGKWIVPKVGTLEHAEVVNILYVMRNGSKPVEQTPKPTIVSCVIDPIDLLPIVQGSVVLKIEPLTEEQHLFLKQQMDQKEQARLVYEQRQKELYDAQEANMCEEIIRRKEALMALSKEPTVYCTVNQRNKKRKTISTSGGIVKVHPCTKIISFTS